MTSAISERTHIQTVRCGNKGCMPTGSSRIVIEAAPSRNGLLEGTFFKRCERCKSVNLIEFVAGVCTVVVIERRG